MKEPAIIASVLGADYARLGHEVAELEAAGVDRIQWDVMDGQLRAQPDLRRRRRGRLPATRHGAVRGAPHGARTRTQWLQPLCRGRLRAPSSSTSRPAGTCTAPCRASGNWACGPGSRSTPRRRWRASRHVLDLVDVLLVMTVNPGFGGQAYLETMEVKIAEARHLISSSGLPTLIEVDGGISAATAPRVWKAGAELLVAGSAILAHPEGRPAAVAELRRSLQPDVQAPSEERAVP